MVPAPVFLLSPARTDGRRCRLLLRRDAGFELAVRLRSLEGAPLGEIFAFLSGLYFRGKLAYAHAFGRPLVITAGRGLLPPETPVDRAELRAFAKIPVDLAEPRYRIPLERDARSLADALRPGTPVVLLGSIASGKYASVLEEIFGPRLLFPKEFVGRGDMSRGGLMLRHVRAGTEMEYVPLAGAVRHGPRPARLPPG